MIRAVVAFLLLLSLSIPAWAEDTSPQPPIPRSSRFLSPIDYSDPTNNVIALVEAAIRRQDDLRTATKELFDAKLEAAAKLDALRSTYDSLLLKVASDRLDEQAKLRAEFATAIAATEKARVDAIRLVDKNAVDVATAGSVATASALAKTVQDTAENSRKLVETTALETNRNIQQQFAAVTALLLPIGTRLTALEQAAAEGTGRQKYQDPAVAALVSEVRSLREDARATKATGEGGWAVIAAIGAVLAFMLSAIGLVVVIMRQRPVK